MFTTLKRTSLWSSTTWCSSHSNWDIYSRLTTLSVNQPLLQWLRWEPLSL